MRRRFLPKGHRDPSDKTSEENSKNWVLGGDANSPEILLIVASDSEMGLEKRVQEINKNSTVESGLKLVCEEAGIVRNELPGHEHFGFGTEFRNRPYGGVSTLYQEICSPNVGLIHQMESISLMRSRVKNLCGQGSSFSDIQAKAMHF